MELLAPLLGLGYGEGWGVDASYRSSAHHHAPPLAVVPVLCPKLTRPRTPRLSPELTRTGVRTVCRKRTLTLTLTLNLTVTLTLTLTLTLTPTLTLTLNPHPHPHP